MTSNNPSLKHIEPQKKRGRRREKEREMATGGSHKGSRGKSYGLMLLLAFGAALFGVMVLHKLRERRIFSLIVKEKDNQLFSLQLLFQKEREYSKEMKKKTEEMRAKIYSLRTQKMELDRRLIEMQSTIDSLKDEQKAMESALEEKQNEIKMQRDVTDLGKENSQLTALKESLMQKEAEIEDLKRRLEYSAKVWSVSTDDPSNPRVNLTNSLNMAEKDKRDSSSSKEENGWLHMATNSMAGENSTRVEDRNGKRVADTNSRELIVEQFQNSENIQDEGFKNGSAAGGKGRDGDQTQEKDSQEQDGFAVEERKNIANSTKQIVVAGRDVSKQRDENSDVKEESGHTTPGKQGNPPDENQDVQAISEGGMKLEMPDTRFQARSRLKRHGRLTRTKGKRWRTLAKHSDSENNGLTSMRARRFYRLDRDDSRTRRESKASNEGIEERERRQKGNNPPKERNAEDSRDVKILEDSQGEQTNENFKSSDSLDTTMLGNKKGDGELTNKQKLDEVRQPEEAGGTQQNMGSRDINEQENEDIQDDNPQEMEVADTTEPETEATDGDSLKESASNLEEDEKEYKEEIEES